MNRKLAAAALVAAAAALAAAAVIAIGRDYVAKIDGSPVSLSEYYIFLYEQINLFEEIGGSDIWEIDFDGETAEDVAKRNALQRLALVRAAARQAKRMELALSPAEEQEALDSARQVLAEMNPETVRECGLTAARAARVMEDRLLLNKVYAQVTDNIMLSESDFEEYVRQYRLDNDAALPPRTAAELSELTDVLRSAYLEDRKRDVFNENYARWTAGSAIAVNDEVYGGIRIVDIMPVP